MSKRGDEDDEEPEPPCLLAKVGPRPLGTEPSPTMYAPATDGKEELNTGSTSLRASQACTSSTFRSKVQPTASPDDHLRCLKCDEKPAEEESKPSGRTAPHGGGCKRGE